MIIHTGSRTDVIHHYSEWMFRRFREGFVYSRNPLFPGRVARYDLSPKKVDAVVFNSKNYAPALSRIREISDCYRTYFLYTINAYGKSIEQNVPSAEESVQTCRELSRIVGREKLVWRYDPVFLTRNITAQFHKEAFARLAEALSPYVSRCIFRFIDYHVRLKSALPGIVQMAQEEKRALVRTFASIAAKHSLAVQTCATSGDFPDCGVPKAGCVTLEAIGQANGCQFRELQHCGIRRGCTCIESRDIGWYDCCLNGCTYCQANSSHEQAAVNAALHETDSPLLIGNVQETDILLQGVQTSYLKHDGRQISLFDLP